MIDLQERLEQLSVDFPAEPDIAPSVMVAISTGAEREPRRSLLGRLAPALAALVIALAALILSPATREAVADWIGLDGIRIGFGEEPSGELGTGLRLGAPTTLDDATEEAGFAIQPPTRLGPPDEVYLSEGAGPVRITFVYGASPDLPRAPTTRVGALLGAFRAGLGDEVIFKKILSTGTQIERIEVDGSPGYWIEGDPHVLFFVDERGHFAEDRARLAANTLAWERDGLVYRLETVLPRDEALEIARSVP